MMSYKGVDVARHLNDLGIDAFILKYRLTYTDPNAQPAAARPAASSSGGPQAGQNVGKLRAPTASRRRLLRQHAAEFNVRPDPSGSSGIPREAPSRWPR